jgi:hypothetical protein
MSHCLCSQTDPSAPIGGYRGPPYEAGGPPARTPSLASARKASSEARRRSLDPGFTRSRSADPAFTRSRPAEDGDSLNPAVGAVNGSEIMHDLY